MNSSSSSWWLAINWRWRFRHHYCPISTQLFLEWLIDWLIDPSYTIWSHLLIYTGRRLEEEGSDTANMSDYSNQHVGIVGATGAVGLEVMSCCHKRNFPVGKLRLFASPRSAGKVISTPYGDITVEGSYLYHFLFFYNLHPYSYNTLLILIIYTTFSSRFVQHLA